MLSYGAVRLSSAFLFDPFNQRSGSPMTRLNLLTGAVITLILLHVPIASADDDTVPANLRKHFDYFVGQWEMTRTVEAAAAVSTVSVRWVSK